MTFAGDPAEGSGMSQEEVPPHLQMPGHHPLPLGARGSLPLSPRPPWAPLLPISHRNSQGHWQVESRDQG